MLIKLKKAQSTAEYAILLSLVIAAAMGIQNYVRRALQARVYDAVHYYASETSELGDTVQWEPSSGQRHTKVVSSTKIREEDPEADFETVIKEDSEQEFDSDVTN
ncbi:MAG: hypothetical protein JSW40_02645 [Candidatus Omnitrophota bacterium]|nr:MAG: hypothetical protein JSW40_02645 [Candidatus Omnitrophota bacterium]